MKTALAAALVALAFLAGCGKPEDKFVGSWDAKFSLPQASIDTIEKQMPGASGQVEEGLSGQVFRLELKKDKNYTLVSGTSAETLDMTGTWSLSEDQKTVTITAPKVTEEARAKLKEQGMTDEAINTMMTEALAFKVSEDGKTLTNEQTQMGITIVITLTKKAA